MTTQPTNPPQRKSRADRLSHLGYFGTSALISFIMVMVGLGAHVYRWEIYVWGGVTLSWALMWARQKNLAETWRVIAQEAIMANRWNEYTSRVAVIQGKPEDTEGK